VRRKPRSTPIARSTIRAALILPLAMFYLLTLLPTPASAVPTKLSPNGQLDFTYGSTVQADGNPATGYKPESKLFYTGDGSTEAVRWWAALGTSGPSPAAGVYLWQLVNHAWVSRLQLPNADPWAKADTLFDGSTLYVSTRDNKGSAGGNSRESDLYEIPYLGNGTWGTVAGPFKITTASPETLTIAKDSAGRLWTTFEQSKKIQVGYTTPSGTTFTFITVSKTNVNSDDISAVTAFGGNKIGVFWSDQVAKRDFFAWRSDSDQITTSWTIETPFGGGVNGCPTANSNLCADDHINIKVYGDQVYIAVKTSLNDVSGAPNDPLIVLLARSSAGSWSAFPVCIVSQDCTRAVTLLSPQQNSIWVWASRADEVDVWQSTFTSPGFTSGAFTPWVKTSGTINDSTSTKQLVTTASGAVVETSKSSSNQYWHNEFLPAGTGPPPTISGFTPTSGSVGTQVTITGSNFTGATSVNFSNNVSASFTVSSDTHISTTVPTGAITGPISVSTLGGTATSANTFSVSSSPPAISGFSPASGAVGTSVTITGSNFTGASSVTFSSNVSASFTVDSDTQISTTVPSGAINGPLSVTTLGGTATSSGSFTVNASAPTVSGISPVFGPEGTPVTITGSNFTGASSVKFFNNVTASFTVDSDTQISTTVPVGAATGPISVTAPGGSASSGTFTVTTSSGSAISEVQRAFGSGGVSSISATFGSTPTEGNLLVAAPVNASSGSGNVPFITPAGWSVGLSEPRAAIFYKVAGANEPRTVTVSDSNGTTYSLRLWIFELSGTDASNPFDQSGWSSFPTGVSTTISTDGITDRTGEWAVAALGWNGAITSGSQSFTDGFTGFPGNARGYAATNVLTPTGIASTTATWTTESAGVKIIGTFRPAP
jgi:hypothetical protein